MSLDASERARDRETASGSGAGSGASGDAHFPSRLAADTQLSVCDGPFSRAHSEDRAEMR